MRKHAKAASAALLWVMMAICIASSCIVNVDSAIWYNPISLGGEILSDSTGSWSSYATAPLTIAVDSTLKKLGSSSIKCAYSDVDTADFYYTFNTPQDLTKYEGLTFWYYGYNTGLMVMMIVSSSDGSSCYYHFYDNNGVGWKHITVYLNIPDAGSWQTIRSTVKKVTWRVSPDASAVVYSPETLPAYMVVRALAGEVSADGVAYASAVMPTWTVNTAAQYYQTTLFLNPEGGEAIVEFPSPQTYGGMTVEVWDGSAWVVMDGASGYALSVPHFFNNSDRFNSSAYASGPPSDWAGTGAPSLVNASGLGGSLYRVQLAVSTSAAVQLRITLRYVTSPIIGAFDGVNDCIKTGDVVLRYIPYTVINIKLTNTQNGVGGPQAVIGQPETSSSGWMYMYRMSWYSANQNYLFVYYNDSASAKKVLNPDYTVNNEKTTVIFWANSSGWHYFKCGATVVSNQQLDFSAYVFDEAPIYVGGVLRGPGIWYYGAAIIYNANMCDVLLFNASSYNPTSGKYEDFSGSNNDGVGYGNVQYKINTIEGFRADIINGTAGVFYLDSPKFEDLRSTYLLMGESDLRNSTVAVNEAYYNFTTYANETANAITFIGFSGGTFVYQPGLNVSSYQNITSNIFTFITADEVTDWALTWDGARLTLSTSPGVDMVDPGDLFSANAAKAFFDARLGIFSYSLVMLIPIAGYLKTKDPGVPAILFLFFAAAGYYIDPSLAPFAELTVVGGLALLAYRIFWSRGK